MVRARVLTRSTFCVMVRYGHFFIRRVFMKIARLVMVFSFLLIGHKAYAYGSGMSSYPLPVGKKLLTAEFLGITSPGGGMGLQVRFAKKVRSNLSLEGGMGISGGMHSSRVFLGGDWEIYPDFSRQPRVSIQGRVINAKEFGIRHNKISLAPSLGKGFSVRGKSFYPYVSFPYIINLAGNQTYETSLNANMGIVGNLPFSRYKHLVGSIGVTTGIGNDFVGFFAGLSWSIE